MFGNSFKKKFSGKPDFNSGGDKPSFGGGDSYERKPFGWEGGGEDEEKKIPGSGRMPEKEGGEEDDKEMKPETPEGEKSEEEAIEEILELFDQLTPLIEKLRNRK